MKIDLIEANMTGLQHAYPNGIYTRIFSKIAGNSNVTLHCSPEHYPNLNVDDLNLNIDYLKVLKPGTKRVQKFFLEYKQTMDIIKKSDADLIIFLSSFPNVQFFHTLAYKKFKDKKIIIMTHGEAEGLVLPGRKWKFWSYPFWITLCYKLELPNNMFRIVLGESILENMRAFSKSDRIYYIDQPRDNFKELNNVTPKNKDNIFAFIGNCLYKKGGESFVKATNEVSLDSKSKFVIIGAYDLDEKEISSRLTLLSKPHEMIPRKLFNESLESVTYACFPYPSDTYKFTASGAVLDAVIYLKPIVYIKNDYFDGIFANAGDIGYRCEDENEFIATIKKLDESSDVDRYNLQVANLRKLQQKFSIDNVEKQLSKIIKNVMNS